MKPWVNIDMSAVEPTEWLFIVALGLMFVFTIGFLLLSYYRRHLDDLDCSKYRVFTPGGMPRTEEEGDLPTPPLNCRLRYLEPRSLWQAPSVNTTWIWITLGLIVAWAALVTAAFLASHGLSIQLL